jgi:hypothetical protein
VNFIVTLHLNLAGSNKFCAAIAIGPRDSPRIVELCDFVAQAMVHFSPVAIPVDQVINDARIVHGPLSDI